MISYTVHLWNVSDQMLAASQKGARSPQISRQSAISDDWLRRCRIASDVAFQESSIVNTITHERWVRLLTRVAYIVAPKRLNPAISDIQSKLMRHICTSSPYRVIACTMGIMKDSPRPAYMADLKARKRGLRKPDCNVV